MPSEKIQPQKNQKSSDQGPSAFGDHPFGQAGGMRQMAPPPLQFSTQPLMSQELQTGPEIGMVESESYKPNGTIQGKFPEEENKSIDSKSIKNCPPVQCKLPPHGPADTKNYYNAEEKSKTLPYKGGRPASFKKRFKEKMIEKEWNGSYNQETGLHFVKTAGPSGVTLPVNAIQIDHKEPWDKIEKTLLTPPGKVYSNTEVQNGVNQGYITPNGNEFSIYGARMYYHDVENLQPMAGSENAAKGAQDSNLLTSSFNYGAFNKRLAQSAGLHAGMLKAGETAEREWGKDPVESSNIIEKLDKIDDMLEHATDYLLGI